MKIMSKGELLSIAAALGGTAGIMWVAMTLTSSGMPSTLATRLSLVAVVIAVALAVGLKLLYRKGKNLREQVLTIIPLVFFTLASLGGLLALLPKAPTSDPGKLVLYYKAQILSLRGNIE